MDNNCDIIKTIEQHFNIYNAMKCEFTEFKLFDQQKKIINAYENNKHNLVMGPRQMGLSSVTAAFLAAKIACADESEPQNIAVMSTNLRASQFFLTKIIDFINQLPVTIGENSSSGHSIVKKSDTRVAFKNGSHIIAKPCTKYAFMGSRPTYIVIEDVAFIGQWAEIYEGAVPAISNGSKLILYSAPNWKNKKFHQTIKDTISHKNNVHITRLHWARDPRFNKGVT